MGLLEERFPWAFPVLAVLLLANALLWALEAISQNQNAYVSVLFIVLNLLGAWFLLRRKHRRKNEKGS
jgi:Co/Zn/Cd efflux system component